jgi:N-acetylglucosaminyldiphosphoundecaprenol N-acetyl-beta-D-mannosaminyltransferase
MTVGMAGSEPRFGRGLTTLEPGLAAQAATVEVEQSCSACDFARLRNTVNTVDFDVLDEDRFAAQIARHIRCGNPHVVHFLAVHPTVAARQVPPYRALLNAGDLVVADGAPIAAVMRRSNRTVRRLTSTTAFWRVCRDGVATGVRHFFVGGANQDVADSMCSALRAAIPAIQIAGVEVPPFRPYTDDEIVALADRIKEARADIVWVGLGAPKQDLLSHRLRAQRCAAVMACVGATFDFVAGTKQRAPSILQRLGLEWTYRLWLEPRRLWRRYLIGNTSFVLSVVLDMARPSRGTESNDERTN